MEKKSIFEENRVQYYLLISYFTAALAMHASQAKAKPSSTGQLEKESDHTHILESSVKIPAK